MSESYWTKERILIALRMHSKEGVAPRMTDWKMTGNGHPTATWVTMQFGTWATACHAAGLITTKEYLAGKERGLPLEHSALAEERLAFVRDLISKGVLRRYLVPQLWRIWGFTNRAAFARWLTQSGIQDDPGWRYRPSRNLTIEEMEAARQLTPQAVLDREGLSSESSRVTADELASF